jgi:hypothetical protein
VDRLRLLRYAGLTGSVLLAVAAYFGGVFPSRRDGPSPAAIWRGEHGPLLLLAWLFGTALLVGAWWALRHGPPSSRWTYVTAGLWLLPLLAAPPLGSRDVYSYACQGAVFAAGRDPYAGGVAELGCPWLDSVSPMWRDSPAPYGPFFLVLAGLAAAVGGTLTGTLALLRLFAVLGMLLTAACLPALARRSGVPPERALWLVLACPLVAVHLVSGAHNDTVMVGLLLAGLLVVAARPGRPVPLLAGGALLGLAVAVKVTALVVLPFAMLAAVAGAYRIRTLARDGGWVAAGALAAPLATSALAGLGFGWVAGVARSGDSLQWTSPPTAVGMVVDYVARPFGWRPDGVPVARTIALVVLAVILVGLWWQAWRSGTREATSVRPAAVPAPVRPAAGRPRHSRTARPVVPPRRALFGAGLALAATVALAPVFHPWYALWPLAVLAATASRIGWFTVPCAVASFLTLPDGTNLARSTKFPGALAMTLLVVVMVVRGVRRLGRKAP